MMETYQSYLGGAVLVVGGALIAAFILCVAALCVKEASIFLFRRGLMFIRLSNWYYWNDRMEQEGLIVMQKFYREQVAIHKPKTLDDFNEMENKARDQP